MSVTKHMTPEEWAYHRVQRKSIAGLGECSRMRNGGFKIEGYSPVFESELEALLKSLLRISTLQSILNKVLSL